MKYYHELGAIYRIGGSATNDRFLAHGSAPCRSGKTRTGFGGAACGSSTNVRYAHSPLENHKGNLIYL